MSSADDRVEVIGIVGEPLTSKGAQLPLRRRAHMIRVLLMDDDEGVLEVTSEILRVFGYEVEIARDGREALELYHEGMISGRRFDIVIMDLTIPGGMGGREAVSELHKLDPQAKAVVSSGHADDPAVAQYIEHGFAGVIPKPYRINELDSRLKKVLEA